MKARGLKRKLFRRYVHIQKWVYDHLSESLILIALITLIGFKYSRYIHIDRSPSGTKEFYYRHYDLGPYDHPSTFQKWAKAKFQQSRNYYYRFIKTTMKNLILVWAFIHYLSPIVFILLSKISYFKIKEKSLFKNYFSYFIIYQCSEILLARLIFNGGFHTLWNSSNLLFLVLPLIVLIAFFLKKDSFVWLYSAFSIGTILFYILNIFEPKMSLRLNMNVIIEVSLILILYLWYLRHYFKEEFSKSYSSLKFWLFDFDAKHAKSYAIPFLILVAVYGVVAIIIIFKFKHVISAKMGFWKQL